MNRLPSMPVSKDIDDVPSRMDDEEHGQQSDYVRQFVNDWFDETRAERAISSIRRSNIEMLRAEIIRLRGELKMGPASDSDPSG